MCFPSGQPAQRPSVPTAPPPPSATSAEVRQRVDAVTRLPQNVMQTVLTSPLGDPKFGRSVSRTLLTGFLT